MRGYLRYFGGKMAWFLITLLCAFLLNFLLPRLMPGDPVAGIMSRLAQGMTDATGVQAIYRQYADLDAYLDHKGESFLAELERLMQEGKLVGIQLVEGNRKLFVIGLFL